MPFPTFPPLNAQSRTARFQHPRPHPERYGRDLLDRESILPTLPPLYPITTSSPIPCLSGGSPLPHESAGCPRLWRILRIQWISSALRFYVAP
jgi:hypothetical protein